MAHTILRKLKYVNDRGVRYTIIAGRMYKVINARPERVVLHSMISVEDELYKVKAKLRICHAGGGC